MRLTAPALLATTLTLGAAMASAHPVTYIGTLSNLGEPAAAASSLGTGTVSIVFDDDAFTMKVDVTFSGMSGNTTASHIHCCTAAAGTGSAGVATPVPTFPGFPLGVTSGSYSQTFDLTQASSWNPAFITANGGTVSSAFAVFSTGLAGGKAYLNIHSTLSAGGEIRTFLVPAPVPEPETYALMLAGLGLLVLRRRSIGR
ncbi:hypothetical protein J2X20_005203 [Pelomonas saccharophila]|uniref:CHRD domain-containing protein n=1 Tax=Roseateles saccharophilus TaxID=304 RepID=A0ABU1YUJ1_ROSSA|nr:CHRD domain-containing protein [Roseateles saccharophilus]MDR7272520.1 hypothetical protein [Roseateles saccharophilus]